MGSFNTTCFASKQTIAPGDACMVVPILQASTFSPVPLKYNGEKSDAYGICDSTCDPTRFWKPVGSFFEAVYADCGRVTLRDTVANRVNLAHFVSEALQSTPEVAEGKNACHDLSYNLRQFMADNAAELLQVVTAERGAKPALAASADLLFEQRVACWEYIFDVAQEQRMFWRARTVALRPMNYAVMHRAAFDSLVALVSRQRDWEGQPLALSSFVKRSVTNARQVLAELTAEFDALDKAGQSVDRYRARLLAEHSAKEAARESLSRVGSFAGCRYLGEASVFNTLLQGVLVDGRLDDDAFFEQIKPWVAVRYALAGLERLNLHLEPMVYASQDYDNEIGRAFVGFASEVSRQVTSERFAGSFGAYRDYSVAARGRAVLKDLATAVRGHDGHLDVTEIDADASHLGYLRVCFRCTLAVQPLKKLLEDFSSGDRVIVGTLTERASDLA